MILISLTGGFVLPPLLLNRVIQPDEHIILYNDSNKDKIESIKGIMRGVLLESFPEDDFHAIIEKIRGYTSRPGCVLDLSGGSRLETLAGYEAARDRLLPFVLVKREKFKYAMVRFEFPRSLPQLAGCTPLVSLLTIRDYLIAHGQQPLEKGSISNSIYSEALERWFRWRCDEYITTQNLFGIHTDLVFRRGNQVGVVILKTQEKYFFEGVDQLAALSSDDKFGSYTSYLLITNRAPDIQLERYARDKGVALAALFGKKDASNGRITFEPQHQRKLERILDEIAGQDWTRPAKPSLHKK